MQQATDAVDDVDREIEQVTGAEEGEQDSIMPTPISEKPQQQHELIHPNSVLKALRAFVEEHKDHSK